MAALDDSPDLDLPDGNLPMADDDFEDLSTFSPKSRRNIKILRQEMKAGKVKLKSSKQGRLYVQYYEETDGSNVNRLCVPKSNELRRQKLEDFFELIEFLKQHANPSGVVIDSDKVSLSQDLKYREGVEFEKLKEILGKGNSSEGDVYVIADKKPGVRHAVKTVAIKSFHTNEIRCWMDLNDTGHVPKLYLIKLEENVVVIHMEALEPAIKFSEIIEGHLSTLAGLENLAKPFSMYLLKGALEAVNSIHKAGWAHGDVSGGNLLLDSDLEVKTIDFGSSHELVSDNGPLDIDNVQEDILQLLTLVIQLYTGKTYIDKDDMMKRYREEIEEHAEYPLSKLDRTEMAEFVDLVMAIAHPDEVEQLKALAEKKLGEALKESGLPLTLVLKKVAAILFPEKGVYLHGRGNLQDHHDPEKRMDASAEQSFPDENVFVTNEKLDQIIKSFGDTFKME